MSRSDASVPGFDASSTLDASSLLDASADGGMAELDARMPEGGSCVASDNIANVSANRCPISDLCPDCTQPSLPEGVYFQLSTAPVALSACGQCQPHGTLRVQGGVFDLVTDESADICTGYVAQQTRVRGPYTLDGEKLHVVDSCGSGTLDWIVRAAGNGMIKLVRTADLDAGTSSAGLVFQRQ